jgi:glucose/arabinose dehydrogenase/cytochrome c553
MKNVFKIIVGVVITLVVLIGVGVAWIYYQSTYNDLYANLFDDNCSSCHGDQLQGIPELGPALLNTELQRGDTVAELMQSISTGNPERGMPAGSESLSSEEIKMLAIYVAERRADRIFTDFKVEFDLVLPQGAIKSQHQSFAVEPVTDQLHSLPYSIAPLPDGRILVTEKTQGLRIISADGALSDVIEGTPAVFDDEITVVGVAFGLGWLMDIKPHPDYANNGWIYLSFTDRCPQCDNILPTSMTKLVRGRIKNNKWVDQETIWQADRSFYTSTPDVAVGARIAFDDQGYVYLSIGIKGASNYHGIQDISTPYGKIHRVHDDGRIPADNPFVDTAGAYPTIWTYGHRSPQGLEFNFKTGQLWSTEMGPRGGDELNLLLPGKNYGWPLYSQGMDYDGTPVEYGKQLDIEYDLEDIQQSVVDLTPAPAISSFIFYQGDQFPNWKDQVIVGSLKATELYRIVLENDKFVSRETLLKRLARIRDVEEGADGNIYLLLEHADGGRVVRLVPDPTPVAD